MPPRFTPFSNSLMQGMQNTNKNIGRMNMPSQFSYGIGNQDGGGSGNLFFTPGEGELPPGSGEGGQPVPGGGIGGWYQPWGENPDYETFEPPGSKPWDDPFKAQISTQRKDPNTGQPNDVLPIGWEWQYVNGEWLPVQISGVGETNPGGGGISPVIGPVGGVVEGGGMLQAPIAQPYHQHTYTLEDYAGGGGQGGQAAKRLYYPGTSGGFASTGSGISGESTLTELLKQMQG